MSAKKDNAFGSSGGDTDFRKKWDLEEYAARGKEQDAAAREEAKARHEAKLAGKKYHKPLDGTESLTTARNSALDFSGMVGKTQLVPAGSAIGRKGRGAGIWCEACDLTFKDDKQFAEHRNSMQHLRNTGQTSEVKRATAEEVRARIDAVWEEMERRRKDEVVTLAERLVVRREEEDRERAEKRKKRLDLQGRKRKLKEEAANVKTAYGSDVRIEGEHDEDDMMVMMGFTSFTASKK